MEKGKHILVVCQYFYPEQFRINDICTDLVKRGFKVTVVTGIPNYPMGKIFPGYGYFKKRRENWNGVEVIRIPLIPRGHSSIGMVLNYLSYVISGRFWTLFTRVKADYVFTFQLSPMTMALVGCWYAKKHHVPHYCYVQDLWPDSVETVTGISSPAVIGPINRMADYIYRNCDEIFATSPSFVDAICNREKPVEPRKVHFWPQYAEDFYEPKERKIIPEIPEDGRFRVIFTGNIGTAQGLQILAETAELLKEQNVRFVMVGDGRYQEQFNREVENRHVTDMFTMIPRQPTERIPELLCACDAAFLSFQDKKLWAMTIPAKLQSYLACGMPVVASAGGETRRILEEAHCGICAEIGDPRALAEAIQKMMESDTAQMGKNSRAYFEAHFRKSDLMDQFVKYFS